MIMWSQLLIEESKDLSTYSMHELMSSLQAHESRINGSSGQSLEQAFQTKLNFSNPGRLKIKEEAILKEMDNSKIIKTVALEDRKIHNKEVVTPTLVAVFAKDLITRQKIVG